LAWRFPGHRFSTFRLFWKRQDALLFLKRYFLKGLLPFPCGKRKDGDWYEKECELPLDFSRSKKAVVRIFLRNMGLIAHFMI